MIEPAKHIAVIETETDTLKLPRKPWGIFPFRLRHDFWNETFVGEVWRGKHYAEIKSKDSHYVIKFMIEAWKRFAK